MASSKIKRSLSSARLSTYEKVQFNGTNLSIEQALKLYSWNAQISAAFFAPLHLCEIVIRNAVAEALTKKYGEKWPWNKTFITSLPDTNRGYNSRNDLINATRSENTTGKVIPELKFVFWEKMLTSRFDDRLWVPYLHSVFPNHEANLSVKEMRNKLRESLANIRDLRNRIAHHEPIFYRDLYLDFDSINALIEYRCKETASWTNKNQIVGLLLQLKPF